MKLFSLLLLGVSCNAVTDIWLKRAVSDAELEARFFQVSDPTHPMYGKYLSQTELADFVGQPQHVVDSLTAWLDSKHLAHKVSNTRDRIEVSSDSLKAAHLPADLADLVTNVVTRVHDSTSHRPRGIQTGLGAYGANEIRKAYGIPDSVTGDGINQLVWGPGTYGVFPSDVKKYWSTYNIAGTSIDRLKLTGYANQTTGGDNFGEASLDTDIISGMAPGAVTIVSNTNNSKSPEEGPGFGYAQNAFLNDLTGEASPAEVVSLSLGSLTWKSCDILCKTVEKEGVESYADCLKEIQYNERQVCMFTNDLVIVQGNVEFMKLGLRGVTVVAASGDGGMHFSFQPFSLFTAIGRALNKAACAYTMPTFPASSPYVTAIGGTQWTAPASAEDPVYWNGGGSGFSWDFPMPSYQTAVVEKYIATHSGDDEFPPASAYNASCRAYPDISALALGNAMCANGRCNGAGGTSAAAPTMGGILTLLNAELKKAGKPVLGFLNTALYQSGAAHADEMFYDVTKGNSKCNSETCLTCTTGFPATPGFDLATGWGAPRWAGLEKYLGQK